MRGSRFIRWLLNMEVAEQPPASVVPAHLQQVAGELAWRCNICGTMNCCLAGTMDRETGDCMHCGAVMRYRSIVAVLTERLFGKVQILAEIAPSPQFTGVGMSDDDRYANLLAEKFSYTNTFYHCEPLLDITRPSPRWLGVNDFVITSDVFEHVPPPIQQSFDNLFSLLKPGGVVVFSVPFNLEAATREHYPNLHDFRIVQEESGDWVLHNVTKAGVSEEFRNLLFHGGPGSTLELRVFCRAALERHLLDAGFTDLRLHSESRFEHGIFWLHPFSLMVSARRPG